MRRRKAASAAMGWTAGAGLLLVLAWGAGVGAAPATRAPELPELIVATYGSLAGKGGFGPEVKRSFEAVCGCRVRFLEAGDAGQIITRLALDAERGRPVAHVALGVDRLSWPRVKAAKLAEPWGDWRPEGWAALRPDAVPARAAEEGFLPFDRGVLAFMRDTRGASREAADPAKLRDLLAPAWARRIVLEDPRTSSPGLGFVHYVRAVIRDAAERQAFWKALRPQWLTLAPGWDEAYGLFLKGEAPLVWSYLSSQAYHAEHGDSEGRYRALRFEEGLPVQIEGAFLVAGHGPAPAAGLGRRFLSHLLRPEVQERLPRTQWMWPARAGVALPDSFARLGEPARLVALEPDAAALEEWGRLVR